MSWTQKMGQNAAQQIVYYGVSLAVGYVALKYVFGPLMSQLVNAPDPAEEEAKAAAQDALARRSAAGHAPLPATNSYEDRLIPDLVFPSQIDTAFSDIGGMSELKHSLHDTVILPLTSPDLFLSLHRSPSGGRASPLLSAPKGVLFYGPPGCGKTLMAKALARHCKAAFLNIRVSTLQNKWFGESQKLVRAIFTLAAKLAPTIVFIDEIDLFLRRRQSSDHEATSAMKGEFMQLWDGLLSSAAAASSAPVLVLGATNRPYDIDDAVLRRMPRQFFFDLPGVEERQQIVDVMLREVRCDEDVDLLRIAEETDGYSGSDLKELCRYAVMGPIRDVMEEQRRDRTQRLQRAGGGGAAADGLEEEMERRQEQTAAAAAGGGDVSVVRSVRMGDFLLALTVVEPTGRESRRYYVDFQRREADKMRHSARQDANGRG